MSKVPIDEIVRLYQADRLSAKAIADRFGVSRQAISARLKDAGIPTRSATVRPVQFEKATLESLYLGEGLTVNQVAERLGTTPARILRAMDRYGIERRKPTAWFVKYPQLRELEIGESIDLPKAERRKPHTQFYSMAAVVGIRVSTRSIDANTIRVTRKE